MKIGKFNISLFFVAVTLFLMGCNQIVTIPTQETATFFSNTNTTTPTFTSTLKPTITPTPTFGPTLPIELVQENVMKMINSNGGCKFPCWWGIEPGQTSWSEADLTLREIGLNMAHYSRGDWYYDSEFFIGAEDGFLNAYEIHTDSNDIVSYITLHSEGVYNLAAFNKIWENVAPGFVIPIYGPPSRIWLKTYSTGCEGELCKTIPYWLWLFYDKQGFLIRYNGYVNFESTYKFCPTFTADGNLGGVLDIYLISIPDSKQLEDYTDLSPQQTQPIDLTVATGMTINDFVDLFNQSGQPVCFTTPRDIWP